MSGLKSRLRRLTASSSARPAARPEAMPPYAGSEAFFIGSAPKPDVDGVQDASEWQALGMQKHRTEAGTFMRRVVRIPLASRWGLYRLDDLQTRSHALSPLCVGHTDEPLDCKRLLFFDTETTGLGIGAGNVPFMIGLGYFEQEAFVIDQCLLRSPADEAAMLSYVQAQMRKRDVLVTFNGRAFDWPIVKNRHVLNRTRSQNERRSKDGSHHDPLHLDFLYAARSLWKHTLPSCKLSVIEQERLGVQRQDDVPGAMAPVLYFRFLQMGDPALLKGVLTHNEQDVLSLVALAVCLSRLLAGEFEPQRFGAEELYRIGLWLDKHGCKDAADKAFVHLTQRDESGLAPFWEQLALVYKRRGQWQRALSLWQRCANVEAGRIRPASIGPLVELAKYYEHRAKDIAAALRFAEQAKASWEARPLLRDHKPQYRQTLAELEHRIERLRRKSDARSAGMNLQEIEQGTLDRRYTQAKEGRR